MKLFVVLMLCAVAAAASQPRYEEPEMPLEVRGETPPSSRNILVNLLVRQLIAFLRSIINNGSSIFGIPPLDPLEIDEYHLNVPAGIINLDLKLKDVYVAGIGGFVVHKSDLNLRTMTFDIDISVPKIVIQAGSYELIGDLFTAIPLFGDGDAEFEIESFRFTGLLHLKQSEDENSVLIDRIESPGFSIPSFKSKLSGVIGGGDIDAIVNAIIEEVLVDYVRRFENLIAGQAAREIVKYGNPVLDRLNTWVFISPFV